MTGERGRYPKVSALRAGLRCRCPRCGEGRLFNGFLTVASRCDVCALDFAFADSGDGPAVFVTLIAGLVVLGVAMAIDMTYEPPLWVYVVFFLPSMVLLCLGLLRPSKSLLIALQYDNDAAPGRLDT